MKFLKRNKEYSKNKSIILLIIYGVFFIFVFVLMAIGNSQSNKNYQDYLDYDNKEEQIKDKEVNSYEYSYKIIDNTNILEITGTKTKNKEIFNIGDNSYYKENNNIYINDGTKTLIEYNDFNTELYSYKNIENLLNEKEVKENTTYEDNSSKEIYSINSKEYFDYMKEDKCINIDCTNINIDIIINKNSKKQIEKANINLSNYYKYNYIVEINYNNINNIKEVSTN